MKRKFLFVVILMFAGAVAYAQPRQGQPAGEISLPDVNGKNVSLSSLKGKIVLIDFWASWCGPCRQSNKHLVKLYEKYKDKGFEIYGISVDDSKDAWKRAIKYDKINWIQVNESNSKDGKVANAWYIQRIPTSFLMNKEGVLIEMNPDDKQLEKYLKENL
ncbi:TlpA family protein disulfide reductase [Pinibacter soli]|uniref:TlpA disulfide reductase family protein n=1 Tax=Pinibacter soli TaxID=3044211 RepID=A0ABT6RES6_9BACT|nr:TlpA disulfide reductase family protein [Pinibacter soli]MDI3321078.1 TlpA disulfide reductase family protein [Pinibacter soli]